MAGEYPLDDQTVYAFGLALAEWAREHQPQSEPQILIGTDTRESGPHLAGLAGAALSASGVRPHFAGVISTPGVAYLTKTSDFIAGLMVSASHNPFQDNGLKLFAHTGYKLPDQEELRLERRLLELRDQVSDPKPAELPHEPIAEAYLDYLAGTVDQDFSQLHLVVDCGNGAAFDLAPHLFTKLGAKVTPIFCEPDGRNINEGCGALHLNTVRDTVVQLGAQAGIAFDGDADRCMLISPAGKVIDGDHTLLIAAKDWQARGRLSSEGAAIVATVMSNLGLERALKELGIAMKRTLVGDKYVLEEMLASGQPLGGEQSGHVIFTDYATTGDGMLTALQTLNAMLRSGRSLDELTADFEVYPQLLVNIRVKERRPLSELDSVRAAIMLAEQEFGDQGRVLVRFSGTEPLARVMAEGADQALVEHHVNAIADAIRRELA